MASRNKQPEGIALLSMYSDEDDEEMEELEEFKEQPQGEEETDYGDTSKIDDMDEDDSRTREMAASESGREITPQGTDDISISTEGEFSHLVLQQSHSSYSSYTKTSTMNSAHTTRIGRERLTIVDYGHDEVAMSPEPEEGEIGSGGRVIFGTELQAANGDVQENVAGETFEGTPSMLATPQSTEHTELSKPDPMIPESEGAEVEEICNVSEEIVDALDKFLRPSPKENCSEDLQRKIDKFLALKKIGKSFNAEVRNRKDYRNPDFLLHAVRYQDIDQIGSCFSKDVFDPHGYDKSDYFDELEVSMKRERERKEAESKRNQKVEFIPGGTQPGVVTSGSKLNIPIPIPCAPALSGTGLHSVAMATDPVARDGRQNKKSKWDKVDGDRRISLPSSGQDSLSAVGANAALLSAANAGAGYTAFAQQRRREAEERRSCERRLERRS